MSHTIQHRAQALRKEVADIANVSRDEVSVVRSPYRVCPLGAHVDHQLGEVTGMALDRELLLGFARATDRTMRVTSHNFPDQIEFDLDDVPEAPVGDWGDYARGAAFALQKHHRLTRGLVGVVDGYDKVGGLSSSAAVGVAYLLALEHANELGLSQSEKIELDRVIENDFIGLNNGILDQSTILLSQKDHLTYLDCESGKTATHPCGADRDLVIVALFSGLRSQLCDTDYNLRVSECEKAANLLLQAADRKVPENPKLRHVTADTFRAHRDALPARLRRRAEHFFGEQERVRKGVELWKSGDLEGFGRLITESGRSSVENYECGNRYLRTAYEVLRQAPGVLGARFSGAGFRGCCIGLADASVEEDPQFRSSVLQSYLEQHPDMESETEIFFCRSADGADLL